MATVEFTSNAISIDREIVSGAPCFAGTRVPVRSLFDYLEGGHSLAEFFADFPSGNAEQACQVLRDTSAGLQEIADRPYRESQ